MATSYQLRADIERVIADEIGTISKVAPSRVAMLYPSPYRAGMSSLGYQVIYGTLNDRDDVVAERAFLPEDPTAWRKSRTPLMTWESWTPVSHCDWIGVSLAYELELPGLLECLDLAGIPIRAEDRTASDPLVVIGGPLTFSNPVPAGLFADVVIMGEAEEAVHVVADTLRDTPDRDAALVALSGQPGFWIPAIHGERLLPVLAVDDTKLPAASRIITPHTELANMHLVEAERGCHRRCSFCVMRRSTNGGMRLADPDRVLATIPDAAPRVGLVGAAVSDHPKLIPILEGIVASGRGFGISSLRADRLSPRFMELLQAGGYRTLTVASDGASERLRKTLQKAIRAPHLLAAAHYAAEYGMRTLKVYMMIGVPGETEDDIAELIEFCRELAAIHPTALGVAPFVAKRNTPLDRQPFAGVKPVDRTLKRLQRELRGRVDVRATSARWAWVEYELAQGGFDMGRATEQAWRDGGGFAAFKRAIRDHRTPAPPDAELRLGLPEGRFAAEGYANVRASDDPETGAAP